MNKLQKVELQILKDVIKILNKYNINYYILGGTLLGAVRHKGFIPWDDDIDIGLFRDDYEKVIQILKNELPENLKLDYYKDNIGKDDYVSYYMMKVENSNIQVINKTAMNNRIMNSWIDIFPIDGLPNNKLLSFIHKFHLLFLRAELRFSQYSNIVNKDTKSKDKLMRIIMKIGNIFKLEKVFNKDKVLDKIDKTLKKYDVKKSKNVINFAGACKSYKFIEIFPKSIYEKVKEYDFENIKVIGPENFDYVLKKQYNNYMELPKETDRNKHNTEII